MPTTLIADLDLESLGVLTERPSKHMGSGQLLDFRDCVQEGSSLWVEGKSKERVGHIFDI